MKAPRRLNVAKPRKRRQGAATDVDGTSGYGYRWRLVSAPAGNNAALSGAAGTAALAALGTVRGADMASPSRGLCSAIWAGL